jgi:hypothetical protein
MRHWSFASFSLVGVLMTVACDQLPVPPAPTPTTATITVLPSMVTATLEEVFNLVANVSVPTAVTDTGVTWRSENTAVATVTAQGIVSCLSEGTTRIIATSRADPTVSGSASVACRTRRFYSLAPQRLVFEHTIGTSPCPQAVGSIEITAGFDGADVFVSSEHRALTVTSFRENLAPGRSASIAVAFNCMTQSSFTGEILFRGGKAGVPDNQTVTVIANIHR